jgi:hypothetical protein
MHSDIKKCTHIFLRQDIRSRALEPLYSSPYQVLSQRENTLQLLMYGRPITVSADRVKLAYTLNGTDCGNKFNPTAAATLAIAPAVTMPQPSTKLHAPVATSIYPLA